MLDLSLLHQGLTALALAVLAAERAGVRTERVLAVRACAVWALTFGIALVFAPFGGVKVVVSLLRRPFRSKPEYTVIWYVPLRSLIVAIVLAPPFLLACAITIPRKMKLHHFVKNRTFLLQKIQLSQKMENLATLRWKRKQAQTGTEPDQDLQGACFRS